MNATLIHCRPNNPWHRDEETKEYKQRAEYNANHIKQTLVRANLFRMWYATLCFKFCLQVALGWSAVCDCGIEGSSSTSIFCAYDQLNKYKN